MDPTSNLILDQKQKKYPPFKKIIIMLGALLFLYVLIWGLSIFLEPQSPVKSLYISNLTDHQVSLSWLTEKPVKGTIAVSKDKLPLIPLFTKKIYKDDSDNGRKNQGRYTTHHVTVTDLEPNTQYNFKIFEGIRGVHQVKVSNPGAVGTFLIPYPIYGRVLTKDQKPATGALVYLTVYSNDKRSNLLSTLTNPDGRWSLDLANLRTNDLKNSFSAGKNMTENLLIVTKDTTVKTATQSGKDKPWPDVILSR